MTYADIQQQVAVILGVRPGSVRDCWIADVKRERGEIRGPAPNRGRGRQGSVLPSHLRQAIRRVLDGELTPMPWGGNRQIEASPATTGIAAKVRPESRAGLSRCVGDGGSDGVISSCRWRIPSRAAVESRERPRHADAPRPESTTRAFHDGCMVHGTLARATRHNLRSAPAAYVTRTLPHAAIGV